MTNLSAFKISFLKDCDQTIPTLANWLHRQWGQVTGETQISDRVAKLHEQKNYQTLPIGFVGFLNDEPVGTIALVENDMTTRDDLSPWIASLFVNPDFRKQGIGEKLVKFVEDYAKTLKFKTLYLYTPDQQKFYKRLGWQEFADGFELNKTVTIFKKDF